MTTVHVPSPVQTDSVKRGLDELIICRQFANRFEDSQVLEEYSVRAKIRQATRKKVSFSVSSVK